MTPGKLNKKWHDRLKETDEESIAHKIINEFLVDIEWLRVEETDEERENRELISQVVETMRKEGIKIDLDG